MKWVEEIIEEARCKGACRLADGIKDEEELIRLLFSAQGREFCELHQFPSLERWESLDAKRMTEYNIYINQGKLSFDISSLKRIAFIGTTIAELKIKGTQCGHTIIVGHGADVRITASDYAVFEVVKIGQCKVDVTLDKTAIQL